LKKENITAVCISEKDEKWSIPDIPLYCHTEGYQKFAHYPPVKTRERIRYLSTRRNAANRRALDLYPSTEHILTVDTYYLSHVDELKKLVGEYVGFDQECILGATTWFPNRSRVPNRLRYWDTWATPEMTDTSYGHRPRNAGLPLGWERVCGCGGFTIYPRWVWEKQGYGIPEPFPNAGNEVNFLCRCPGIATYVTFNVRAVREVPEGMRDMSLIRRIRTTLGLGSRMAMARDSTRRDGMKWSLRGATDASVATGSHESFLKSRILKPGKIFVDVGAHVGAWALRATKFYEQVIALEPNLEAFDVLKRNMVLNKTTNLRALWAAASDENGELTLFGYEKPSWTSSFEASMGHSTIGRKMIVQCLTIDSLGLDPSLVKIDTEGHEPHVLRGMIETLQYKPKLVVETHNNMPEVTSLLEGAGYKDIKSLKTADTTYLIAD